MKNKMCEECPFLDWDYVRVGGQKLSWDECPDADFDPADENCPRHAEFLMRQAEEAAENE